jgi:protoheme IX farnesyltransferase
MKWIRILFELTKFRISLFATLSTSLGFILARQGISREIVLPIIGIFLLACGSCALNQYQERKNDQWMERTQKRPLPSKRLHPITGLKISLLFLLGGASILMAGTNWTALGLGAFAVFWYNGIYTPLKRKTAFAVIPGALIGTIPPVLGWVSGGGHLLDPQILAVAFFFFIWQIPHFWLLLLDFGKDYEKAGFPSLTRIFTAAQLRRILFAWVFATAVTCLILPLFGLVTSHAVQVGFLVAGFGLVWRAARFLITQDSKLSFSSPFHAINAYMISVILLFSLDHLFR